MKRLLLIPDVHAPYQDHRACRLLFKAIESFKPDIVVSLGDLADFYTVSSHSKDPRRKLMLAHELAGVNKFLDQLDASCKKARVKKKFITLGNHEHRLQRFLEEKAPELYGLVSTEQALRLKERGYAVTQYGESLKIGKLYLTHCLDGQAGAGALAKAQAAFEGSVCIGHTHRMQTVYAGSVTGKSHVGASFGWLGSVSQIDYMHKASANRAWQLGFGIAFMEPSGVVHVQSVPIIKYRAVVNGVLIK